MIRHDHPKPQSLQKVRIEPQQADSPGRLPKSRETHRHIETRSVQPNK